MSEAHYLLVKGFGLTGIVICTARQAIDEPPVTRGLATRQLEARQA
jgi:hypothetical protein